MHTLKFFQKLEEREFDANSSGTNVLCIAAVNHLLRGQWVTSLIWKKVYAWGRLRLDHGHGVLRYHKLNCSPVMTPIKATKLLRGLEVEAFIQLFTLVPKRFWGLSQSCARHDAKAINVAIQTQLARMILHTSFRDIPHGMLCVFQLVYHHS